MKNLVNQIKDMIIKAFNSIVGIIEDAIKKITAILKTLKPW